jgi:hypothetical protein
MSNIARRERKKMMTQVPGERPQRGMGRRTRLFLAAGLVAAVLVIGTLAVASALLFNKHNTGNEPQPGATPISITLSSCASQPMPVLVDLCTQHQLTDLLQSRKIDTYVLVLERAYLDMNQLVITYRVFSQSTGQQTLADLGTVITTSQGQSFQFSGGAYMNGGPQVVQFSTPPVPAQTRALQLHVEVNGFRLENLARPGTPPAPQLTAVHVSATFDFTLEYHGGLVVTPHQTVTVNADSVTLERVLISPSETILEGSTKGTIPTSEYTVLLDAAGRGPDGPSSSSFGGDSNPFSVEYYDGLLGQHGTWAFTISSVLEGPWVFHFRVP